MQLSKRLQAVAGLVTPGSRVADIGCDHAYTSIYLVKNNGSPHIIAMDVNQGPLQRANENIAKYGCKDRIETRRSDGLEKLHKEEADAILIAGMGGALIISILSERVEVMRSVRELILQPQSELSKVRQFLQEQSFFIVEENMLIEDGKYYVMMKAKPFFGKPTSTELILTEEEHFHYGRLLLESRNQTLREFLLWDLNVCEGILENIDQVQSEATLMRRKEIEARITLIRKGLHYF